VRKRVDKQITSPTRLRAKQRVACPVLPPLYLPFFFVPVLGERKKRLWIPSEASNAPQGFRARTPSTRAGAHLPHTNTYTNQRKGGMAASLLPHAGKRLACPHPLRPSPRFTVLRGTAVSQSVPSCKSAPSPALWPPQYHHPTRTLF